MSDRPDGVLFDLLMGVMNSLDVWAAAAHDRRRGVAWRDAVSARMISAAAYEPYEALIVQAAAEVGLPSRAVPELLDRWGQMEPWPDAAAIEGLDLPYGFVTNCSTALAQIAANRSGLTPHMVVAAEEIGWYKPHRAAYLEACRRLGTRPGETWFVAGSPYDAEGARDAGLRSTLVMRRSDQRRPSSSIRVVASLVDVVAELDATG